MRQSDFCVTKIVEMRARSHSQICNDPNRYHSYLVPLMKFDWGEQYDDSLLSWAFTARVRVSLLFAKLVLSARIFSVSCARSVIFMPS